MRFNDILPIGSGSASIGVNQTGQDTFDITSISPFNRFHVVSGIFHDELQGQSGVLRYSRQKAGFEISVDGGKTFATLASTASVVTSIGVLGDADLTGAVDVASPASGFIVIQDSADASPLLWSVNTLGLSGLWSLPANGFPSTIVRSFAATFSAATTWTISHNISTADIVIACYDASSPRKFLIPDDITLTDVNTVTVSFNVAQAGRAVVMGAV